jgi:hypothetical protein
MALIAKVQVRNICHSTMGKRSSDHDHLISPAGMMQIFLFSPPPGAANNAVYKFDMDGDLTSKFDVDGQARVWLVAARTYLIAELLESNM